MCQKNSFFMEICNSLSPAAAAAPPFTLTEKTKTIEGGKIEHQKQLDYGPYGLRTGKLRKTSRSRFCLRVSCAAQGVPTPQELRCTLFSFLFFLERKGKRDDMASSGVMMDHRQLSDGVRAIIKGNNSSDSTPRYLFHLRCSIFYGVYCPLVILYLHTTGVNSSTEQLRLLRCVNTSSSSCTNEPRSPLKKCSKQ